MSLLSKVTKEAKSQPPRIVLYAGEKFGKTSWAAHAWKPLFLMTQGETGLLSLLESGLVPPVDHFPEDFRSWWGLDQAVKAVRDDPHEFKTLVIDTGNGAEHLCAQMVCDEQFSGNWGEYNAFGRGNERATKPWTDFLKLLDEVRAKRRMAVVILHHARVKTFNDPAGKSWDQWRPEAIDKLWSLTHKWADCIIFGGFRVMVNRDDKATGEERYLRTGTSGATVAGNRYGLRDEITARSGAANLWKAFVDELLKSKQRAAGPKPEPPKADPPNAGKPAPQNPTPPADGTPAPSVGMLVALVDRLAAYGEDRTRVLNRVCGWFNAADFDQLAPEQRATAADRLEAEIEVMETPVAH